MRYLYILTYVTYYIVCIPTRVVKKLETLKPDPTDHFGPHRGLDPKKPDPRKVKPDPTRPRTFGFEVGSGIYPKP